MSFEQSPLITPERLTSDPIEALAVRPVWATPYAIEGHDEDLSLACFVVVGRKHTKALTLSVAGLALLCEITRFGHNVTTNSNFGKPIPIIYAKVTFRDAPKDDVTLGRIFAGATANEAVKTLEMVNDMRPLNLYRIGAGRPEKSARDLVLRHCERLALERQAGGTLPDGHSVAAYVTNIRNLYEALDAELEAAEKGA